MNYFDRFKKKNTQNFIKIHPVGAQLFHTEGQTDTTKLNSCFPQFCESARQRVYSQNVSPVQQQSRKAVVFKVSFYAGLSMKK